MSFDERPVKAKWAEQLILLKAKVAGLPPGPQRNEAELRVRQLEFDITMEGWVKASALQPPN